MRIRITLASLLVLLFALFAPVALALPALSVVSARPAGETSDLGESREITVVFSEPMVTLGRIPEVVTAPFFKIQPAIKGTFRWSGTTILVFTPDPKVRLPYSTRYTVTIDVTATATSGRTLAAPYRFSFVTPTVKLLATNWYRQGNRFDGPLVIGFRFSQPVRAADLLPRLSLHYQRHEWKRPTLTPASEARLRATDMPGLQAFQAKVAAADAAATSTAPVQVGAVATWDTKRLGKPESTLIVVKTATVPPPESWVRAEFAAGLTGLQGRVPSASAQSYTLELEPTFFADGPNCTSGCDPAYWNPLQLRREVPTASARKAFSVADITTPTAKPPARRKTGTARASDRSTYFTIEDLGYDRQPPATTFAYRLEPTLQSVDGQTLGYPWVAVVENWHERAFTSFGDGHGVWESSGGPVLPFYSRNFTTLKQWMAPVATSDLVPTIVALQQRNFASAPDAPAVNRTLKPKADVIQSHGLDLTSALTGGHGLVWAAIEQGKPIPRAATYGEGTRATVVQVTNLGITVKDSPQNTLVFVTRLDTAAPVEGAKVSIVTLQNKTAWTGVTNADGVAIAPALPLRKPAPWYDTRFEFVVLAEKDGDTAYVGSDWTEGITPWEFGSTYDTVEQNSLLRGTVFADRGVYRLGEEVHFKAILRNDTPAGIKVPDAGTPVYVMVRDSQSREIDRRTVKLSAWGSTEWAWTLPGSGALGNYSVTMRLRPYEETTAKPSTELAQELKVEDQVETEDASSFEPRDSVSGGFLVAAYRRPDFRVDATLGSATPFAGTTLTGHVSARYLFGAPMKEAPLRWSITRQALGGAPSSLTANFPHDGYDFGVWPKGGSRTEVKADESTTSADGTFDVELETTSGDAMRYEYQIEGEVTDVSRQRIANRAAVAIHPASVYVGVKIPYFVDEPASARVSVVALTPDGVPVPDTTIAVTISHVQWISTRRAEGSGFYTWDTEEKVTEVGTFTTTSKAEPVELPIPLTEGGYYRLRAEAHDANGRLAATEGSFYALGSGYTAWSRYDHNRIDLVPERKVYKPGDTARIMIKSPWEKATALVTTEREGIRTHRRFALESSQQSISVPLTEADIPNVYVSVLLVKGRTENATPADGSDPGKPSFRLGYVQLEVEDSSKRLTVTAKADKEEFRPANKAHVAVTVKDRAGLPSESEVTLWAVDYGVLSLTAFQTPDVLHSVYVRKALQVLTTDSRQRIVSRRVLTPKGGDEGGGGGEEPGAGTMRKDFRVLAFWVGSVVTDGKGQASIDVTLPESLTTYRIMAVAADKASRFGSAESEIRVNKPVTMKPTFPRFLARGDKASFGAVITSQLPTKGTATVTMKSLDPAVLELTGALSRTASVDAGGAVEVRFDAIAKTIGKARIQMTARIGNESDAFEDSIPVEVLVSPETVSAYGDTAESARETLTVPGGVVPNFGGLRLELASTAMVGLGEGARYLVEYPYGCAEQRSSRALALLLAADLGEAFSLPGLKTKDMRTIAQAQILDLERYQCADGGFAYWPGECLWVSPYLTSYVLHVFQVAASLDYTVKPDVMKKAYDYLDRELAKEPPENESWFPAYTAWQAFAVKVLVEGGRNEDAHIARLLGYIDRMPVFGLTYLADALVAKGEDGPRLAELRRRMKNAVLPEAGSAHVEELNDPYLLWFWNSNVRSTAIVLKHYAKQASPDTDLRAMVRWMMAARKAGRWGNTQENALAMEALVTYYRQHEAEVPDFAAAVTLGTESLMTQPFKGRSATAAVKEVPMPALLEKGQPGTQKDLTFSKRGTGRLFYGARLRYAVDAPRQTSLDSGFSITRKYEPTEPGAAGATGPASTTYKAGDLVRVTLAFDLTKERRYVAVVDPLPAGFEPVDSWFATTARDLAARNDDEDAPQEWWLAWEKGGFDHVEKLDDQVRLFATRLSEGHHEFSYIVRATTSGRYTAAPAHAEEMYEPEVFGRTETASVDVK